MTGPAEPYEYGIELRFRDGYTFVAPRRNRDVAERDARSLAGSLWHPQATGRVMRREVGAWRPLNESPVTEGATPS